MTKSLIKLLSVLLLCSTANVFADEFADNLGLTLLPVESSTQVKAASSHAKPPLVIFLSGDGGWATLDKAVGGILQQQGWPAPLLLYLPCRPHMPGWLPLHPITIWKS